MGLSRALAPSGAAEGPVPWLGVELVGLSARRVQLGEAPEASDGGVWTQRTPSAPPGPQAPLGRVSGGCSHRLGREQTLTRPLPVGRAGPGGLGEDLLRPQLLVAPHSSVSPNMSGLLTGTRRRAQKSPPASVTGTEQVQM